MMKNKIFDKKLYVEGLNQLKNPFIITLVIFFVTSLLFPLLQVSENVSCSKLLQANYCLALIPYICATVFTFSLFSFLFKRNSCDFYHSLAPKRTTLFISFYLTITTMLIALIIICSLMSTASTVVVSKMNNCIVTASFYSSIIPTILNLIAACALMASGITIGCAVSGRGISAFITSGIILFYPRALLTLTINVFKEQNLIIDHKDFDIIFGNDCNALTGAVFNSFTQYKSVVYSLILAVIYFIFGMILFNRRKSEVAANMSMGKVSQAIVRIAFCMIFCIPACLILYSQSAESDTEIICAVFWFFAIVAYILFEVITQRSFKTLPRAIAQFVFVIILNIAIVAGLNLTEYQVKSYQPNQNSVESVSFAQNSDYAKTVYSAYVISDVSVYRFDNEIANHLETVTVKNDTVEKILCEALSKTINDEDYAEYLYNYDSNNCYYTLSVTFNDISKKHRNVIISENDIKKICYELQKDEDFMEAATEFPEEFSECSISADFYGTYLEFSSEKEKGCTDVYNIAREEIKNISAENLFTYYFVNGLYGDPVGEIVVFDEKGYKYKMPVYKNMTETMAETTDLAINSNQNKKDFIKVSECINNSDWDITIDQYDFTKSGHISNTYSIKEGKEKEFKDYIQKNSLKNDENSVIINLYANRIFETDEEEDEFYKTSTEDTYFSTICYISKDAVKEYLYEYY